jgi:hypothetical protein
MAQLQGKAQAQTQTQINNRMTKEDRDSWISQAINSEHLNGKNNIGLGYKVLPNMNGVIMNKDDIKEETTKVVCDVLYNENTPYRKITFNFLKTLNFLMNSNTFLKPFAQQGHIHVILKGSSALALGFPHLGFEMSDLDFTVVINPHLPVHVFDRVFQAMQHIIEEALALHKKLLDNYMFMKTRDTRIPTFMADDDIEEFKNAFNEAMTQNDFMPLFHNDFNRNMLSRHSFEIVPSNCTSFDVPSVVKVEVPHFDNLSHLPLKKTPLFASKNSIKIESNNSMTRSFELWRLKMNIGVYNTHDGDRIKTSIAVKENEQVALSLTYIQTYYKKDAELIDITMSHQSDPELHDMWKNERFMTVKDNITGMFIKVPDLNASIHGLRKLLYVYESDESKKTKRENKLQRLVNYANLIQIQQTMSNSIKMQNSVNQVHFPPLLY